MSGIFLDHAAALDALGRLIDDGEEQRHHHVSAGPSLPASTFGPGFTDRAAAVAAVLRRVHEAGTRRIDAVLDTAAAASLQVREFGDVDKQTSRDFGGVA